MPIEFTARGHPIYTSAFNASVYSVLRAEGPTGTWSEYNDNHGVQASVPMMESDFAAITTLTKQTAKWTDMAIFEPFDDSVWGAIVFTAVVIGLGLAALDARTNQDLGTMDVRDCVRYAAGGMYHGDYKTQSVR